MRMHRVPATELSTSKLRLTRFAPVVLAIYSVTMCVILINVYIQPYQEITGTLNAGGGINWLSGESLLVLAGPVVVVPTAWIAWRMISRSYAPGER